MPRLVVGNTELIGGKSKSGNRFLKPNFGVGPNPDSGPFTAIASLQQLPVAE